MLLGGSTGELLLLLLLLLGPCVEVMPELVHWRGIRRLLCLLLLLLRLLLLLLLLLLLQHGWVCKGVALKHLLWKRGIGGGVGCWGDTGRGEAWLLLLQLLLKLCIEGAEHGRVGHGP